MDDSLNAGSENKLPLIISVVAVGAAVLALLFAYKAKTEATGAKAELVAAKTELKQEIDAAKSGTAKASEVAAIGDEVQTFKATMTASYDQVATAIRAQNEVIKGLATKRPAPVAPVAGNGTKAADAPAAAGEYKVKSGDTFAKIAKANGVTLAAMIAANPGVDAAKLKVGQTIKLPAKK